MKYILALDQGTTSSRAVLLGRDGRVHGSAQTPFKQIFPKPGWVEHDPVEIWSSQFGVAMEALAQANIEASLIAAIGITNQRETAIIWDRKTGEPVYNAIVWQDRRTSGFCDRLREQAGARERGFLAALPPGGRRLRRRVHHRVAARRARAVARFRGGHGQRCARPAHGAK